MNKVVDPIEAVNPSQKAYGAQSGSVAGADGSGKKSDFLFSTNYIIAVMELTNMAMQHQSDVVKLRGELADVVTRIQSDLSVINQYTSTIESQATNYGLQSGYYYVNTTNEFPSQSYQDSTASFVKAVRDLFACDTAGPGDLTVADISKIQDSYGQTFDLGASQSGSPSFWGNLQGAFATKYPSPLPLVTASSNRKPSLIQQYIYYSAQLSVNTCSKEDLQAAGGDITKVPGVNFDPSQSSSFDPTLNSVLGVFSSLSAIPGGTGRWDSPLALAETGTINDPSGQDHYGDTKYIPYFNWENGSSYGLYYTFNHFADDYYGAKNPTSGAPTDEGDGLSAMYMSSSSAQSTLSSSSSNTNTNFQQDTSSVQTINNAAQQMIQSFTQGQGSMIQNFKG